MKEINNIEDIEKIKEEIESPKKSFLKKEISIKYFYIFMGIIIFIFIIFFNLLLYINTNYDIKYSKAVFDDNRTNYNIKNSSLSEIMFNHPYEAYKNCRLWDSPNTNKYKKIEKSKLYSCSILKYENIIYIVEIKNNII